MSCFMSTGNMCDIVYDYIYPEGYDRPGIQVFKGIRARNGQLIPLPDPEAFISCLQEILFECQQSRRKYELSRFSGNSESDSKD
jgi:hypothetical protein